MKIKNITAFNTLISLLTTTIFINLLFSTNTISSLTITAGFSEAYDKITESLSSSIQTIKEFGTFTTMVLSTIATIISFIGIKAILILIAAVFISNFLSIFGFEKDKKTFFTSVILVNILWISWVIKHGSFSESFISIIKTNGIILIPSITLIIIKFLSGYLRKKLKKNKNTMEEGEILTISEEILTNSSKAVISLNKDIISSESNKVALSYESKQLLQCLEESLKKLHNNNFTDTNIPKTIDLDNISNITPNQNNNDN